MSETTTPSSPVRRRGRPRSFDRDAVTAAVLGVLWRKGYAETSVDDLVSATGLAPSSLYAAFGSKLGLMEAALARYDRDRDDLLAPLERGSAGLADVHRFLDGVRDALTRADPVGCFMVNTAAGAAAHHPVIAEHAGAYRERVRDALDAALRRAADRGEIAGAGPDDIRRRALVLQAGVYGAQVAGRVGHGADAVAAVDGLGDLLEQWSAQPALAPKAASRPL